MFQKTGDDTNSFVEPILASKHPYKGKFIRWLPQVAPLQTTALAFLGTLSAPFLPLIRGGKGGGANADRMMPCRNCNLCAISNLGSTTASYYGIALAKGT